MDGTEAGWVAVDLGDLGGPESFAREINDAGQIVGDGETAAGHARAFIWEAGVITDLGTLGGDESRLRGSRPSQMLSESGHVIGYSTTLTDTLEHAFVWHEGVMTELGSLGGTEGLFGGPPTDPRAVNGAGQVVGGSVLPGDSVQHSFLWEAGVMTDLGSLGGPVSVATALTEAGAVAGRSTDPGGAFRIYRWESGVLTDLGNLSPGITGGSAFSVVYGMNASGSITGRSTRPDTMQVAFLWDGSTLQELQGLGGTGDFAGDRIGQPLDINADGLIVGSAQTPSGEDHAVRWEGGAAVALETLGGTRSWANAVNDSGQIAGWSRDTSGVLKPVVWEEGRVVELDLLGSETGSAADINNSGWIVGSRGGSGLPSRATLWRPGAPLWPADTLVLSGDTVQVEIRADMTRLSRAIGDLRAMVRFDTAVVELVSVGPGDFQGSFSTDTDSAAQGVVGFTGINADGGANRDTTVVAALGFTPVADSGASVISLEVDTLLATDASDLSPLALPRNATLGISNGFWGDPNRDLTIGALDALICLSEVVGRDTSAFDVTACDVEPDDGDAFDQTVTALDALLILSDVVGRPLPAQSRVGRLR